MTVTPMFDKTDFDNLIAGKQITKTVNANTMAGFLVTNVTPYFFALVDETGNLIATVPPWQTVIGSITQNSQTVTVQSITNRPVVSVASANDDSQWSVELELSQVSQPSQMVGLSVANAANVTVTGTMNATIQNAQINTQVTNALLSVSNAVDWGMHTQTLNLGPGVTSPFLTHSGTTGVLTDELFFFIYIPNNDASNFQLSVTVGDMGNISYDYFPTSPTITQIANNGYGLLYRVTLNGTYMMDTVGFYIKNISGAATITETVQIHVWAKYASQTITNPTSSPVYNQASVGSFPAQYAINVSVGATGSATTLVPAAQGGYIQALQLTIQGTGTAGETVAIQNGSQYLEQGILVNNGSTVSKSYNFGSGVANNGITISETAFSAGSSMTITGYAVISQNAAPQVTATIR